MAVTALEPAGSAVAGASRNAFGELKPEEFVKIIFTELANQDPLQPNDSQALLEQLSTIRSIQSDIDMGQRLGSLVAQNEMSAAAGLIGKTAKGRGDAGAKVTGIVKSVTRTADGAVLNLSGGARLPMRSLDEVLDAPPPGATP